jgi:hypothetical protein
MKQFLTVVAVGVLGAFLLVACGGSQKPAESGAGASSAAPAESAAPAASPAAS